ncbi:hypothetical protein B0H14DRAFT_3661658 [Mycena olivaceomarginata]|nr:hypothetical protein B0H14DRAFT_3661658 [Mycena olivaceomarginata]
MYELGPDRQLKFYAQHDSTLGGYRIVTVRPGRRTAPKTAVQWTVRRRYGRTASLMALDGTGRWTGRPSTVDGRHVSGSEGGEAGADGRSDGSNVVGDDVDGCTHQPSRRVTWQSVVAVHPSVVRRPVDVTPVFTTVRRRDGMLRGPTAQRRDGTVVRPSVRPTVLDGYGDDPYGWLNDPRQP